MASPVQVGFAHRFNPDGTVDSICRQCFITVDSKKREADLAPSEHRHVCDPGLLQHLYKLNSYFGTAEGRQRALRR